MTSQLPIVLGMNINENSDKVYSSWPDSAPWSSPFPQIPRYTSHLIWANWDKYYLHQVDDNIPMKGGLHVTIMIVKLFISNLLI